MRLEQAGGCELLYELGCRKGRILQLSAMLLACCQRPFLMKIDDVHEEGVWVDDLYVVGGDFVRREVPQVKSYNRIGLGADSGSENVPVSGVGQVQATDYRIGCLNDRIWKGDLHRCELPREIGRVVSKPALDALLPLGEDRVGPDWPVQALRSEPEQ